MKKTLLLLIMSLSLAVLPGCEKDDVKEATDDVKDAIKKMTGELTAWGTYCGPGTTKDGVAVDSMDECCQAHDTCYTDNDISYSEYAECVEGDKLDCDVAFVECLDGLNDSSALWAKKPVPDSEQSQEDAEAEADTYRANAMAIFQTCEDIADAISAASN